MRGAGSRAFSSSPVPPTNTSHDTQRATYCTSTGSYLRFSRSPPPVRSLHATGAALRVRLEHHVADGARGVDVAVGAPRDARLLAAAQARAGLRDALLEALLAHGLRRSWRKGRRLVRIRRDLRRAPKQRTAGSAFRGKSISRVTRAHREELLRVRVRQLRLDLVHHRLRVLAVHPERRRRAGASRSGQSEINDLDSRELSRTWYRRTSQTFLTNCRLNAHTIRNGRLTAVALTATAASDRAEKRRPTRTRATRASSVRPNRQSARG